MDSAESVSKVPLLCKNNIKLGLPHGSIFIVSEMVWTGLEPKAAGYVVYCSATILIINLRKQVSEFTLDQGFTF
jgi:fructose-1,6-bisphosphatase